MDAHVIAMVLAAALLHAAWNLLVKVNQDRFAVMAGITASAGLISPVALPFAPPPDPAAWPLIVLSVGLHTGYVLFLLAAYRYGDLSHVYPIARGVAPLVVAVLSVFLLAEALSRQTLAAVLIIGLGIMSLALTRRTSELRDLRAVALAVVTGCFIAAYTVVDGLGARLAGTPHGYTLWLFALDGFPLALILLAARQRKSAGLARRYWRLGLIGGALSLGAYWLVIWALTLAPLAPVAALRETSIVFAVLFGVFFLKERLNLVRLIATMATLVGTVMLKTGK